MEQKLLDISEAFKAAGWDEAQPYRGADQVFAMHYQSGMAIVVVPVANYAGSPSGVLEGSIEGEFEFQIEIADLPPIPTPYAIWEAAREAIAKDNCNEDLLGAFPEVE